MLASSDALINREGGKSGIGQATYNSGVITRWNEFGNSLRRVEARSYSILFCIPDMKRKAVAFG